MSRPSLLFLPGLLCDTRLWEQQVADLRHHANCHVADLTLEDSIAGMAASALRSVARGPIMVAGLSMGGYVALEILRQAPERVAGLALLDTNARPDSEQASEGRRRMMKLAERDFERVVAGLLPMLLLPANTRDAALVAKVKAMAAAVGRQAYIRQQTAIIGRADSRPHLAQIRCPTLVLCGREDILTPVALHEEIAGAIPGSRLVVLDKCGHLSPLEQPRQVTHNLVQWLAGLPG